MSVSIRNIDYYRDATKQIIPAAPIRRMTCTQCRKHQSIGQFEVGEDICVKCIPKPAGWRRGGL